MTSGLGARCAMAIMAKAPRVGGVKTRLSPPLSASEAAALGAAFLQDIAGNLLAAAQSAPIDGFVAYSPAGSQGILRALLPEQIGLLPPRRSGLGAGLCDAAADLLAAGYGSVCLVNADSPTLPTAVLTAAARALAPAGDRIALGPAADGGYYLIGVKNPHWRLFEDIAWSTERVLRQTLERAAEIGLEAVTLAPWYDVDDIATLRLLLAELIGGKSGGADPGYGAPHTLCCLRLLLAENRAVRRLLDGA